jgi:hypothetical protein
MSNHEKLLLQVLRGISDKNIPFKDLCQLLYYLGFDERILGDHHIFNKDDVEEILNLQPKGSKAKPYQVKQVRNVIINITLLNNTYKKIFLSRK